MDLTEKQWHRRSVSGLEGVSAEFRDLTGREFRDFSRIDRVDLFADRMVEILKGSIRNIEGLEVEGSAVTTADQLLDELPVRHINAFVTQLLLSQYQGDDSGN